MRLRVIPERLSAPQGFGLLVAFILLPAAVLIGMASLVMRPARTTTQNDNARPNSQAILGAPARGNPIASGTATAAPASNGSRLLVASPAAPGQSLRSSTGTANPTLPLLGRRVGLDPGHGPRDDLGAVLVDPDTGKLVLSEAEFNLDVALRCRDLLRARGANVVLTRETAKTFTAPWPVDANGDGIVGGSRDDLQERVDILNAFNAEVFLSIHANSARNRTDLGKVQVFDCSASDCAFPAESRRLSKLVLDQLKTKLSAAGYPVQIPQLHSDLWPDGLHLFILGPVDPPNHVRATRMPGALSETLYVTSPAEAAQLKRNSIRQAIALAYADALQSFLTGSNGQ